MLSLMTWLDLKAENITKCVVNVIIIIRLLLHYYVSLLSVVISGPDYATARKYDSCKHVTFYQCQQET